jgi:polyisoprenoid-binding protein YceI
MKHAIITLALALAACGAPQQAPEQAVAEAAVEHTAPAGAYTLDKAHGSLIVRVNHSGYSFFTARFVDWDADLTLAPAAPETSSINVRIDPRSIASDHAPDGFMAIMRDDFLQAPRHPEISFRSTSVERTGANTARIVGDLTLLGQTHPVTLEARFNGGYEGMHLDPHARVGFSARGTFNRSDFGMSYGLPPEGSNLGVGDNVEVIVEAEFNGPDWRPPASTAPSP